MNLYLSHSSSYDFQNNLYIPLKEGLGRGHSIFFPHDIHDEGINSKKIIFESDIVIAEVSYPSTGQGIELGWANTGGVPLICFYLSGSKISSSLRFVSNIFIEYENKVDMVDKLNLEITKVAATL